MGVATVASHDPTTDPSKQANDKNAAQAMVVHFPRASREHTEPAFDVSPVMTAATQQLGPFDIPAVGYMRDIILLVQATGGAGGGNTVAAAADAPWIALQAVSLEDVNGQTIIGPFSGYDLFLANKWGGYVFNPDPAVAFEFSNVVVGAGASGNFTFSLRFPVEINAREALGALPNQSTAQQFKLRVTLNASTSIYTTVPATTLPTVRLRGYLEAWFQPADPTITPPALGTTQFWTKQSPVVASGSQTIKIARVGNKIRNLIFVARDTGGARSTSMLPDPFEIDLDGRRMENLARIVQQKRMAERFGFAAASVDTGVLVFDFTHDFGGHPGQGELRDLWLETLQSSRLEVVGSFGAAGTLDIIVNDVVPAKGVVL